jgi:hypothetical protein
MRDCKNCNQAISWEQKKRETIHIRGPLNVDGTMHQCVNRIIEQEIALKPQTRHTDKVVIDQTKEELILKAMYELTYPANALVYVTLGDSEGARNIVKVARK